MKMITRCKKAKQLEQHSSLIECFNTSFSEIHRARSSKIIKILDDINKTISFTKLSQNIAFCKQNIHPFVHSM